MAKDKITWKDNRGFILGNILGSALFPGLGTLLGGWSGAAIDRQRNEPGSLKQDITNAYNDVTGKTNTEMQNSAAASLQEDAQQHQIDMLGYQTSASLDYAKQLPSAQVEGLKAAGLNPVLAAGQGFDGAMTSSSAGVASAQASNVSALQSIANTAITAGMLIKILKTIK